MHGIIYHYRSINRRVDNYLLMEVPGTSQNGKTVVADVVKFSALIRITIWYVEMSLSIAAMSVSLIQPGMN
jgi:hypothetical protein